MVDQFPFGKAPFWLLCLALASSLLVLATRKEAAAERAELTLTTYTPPHIPAYKRVLPAFERKHGVKVSLQLVDSRALETRLQNSMLAGTEVPDLVEILDGGMGFFTRGPLSDVGFLDITERMQLKAPDVLWNEITITDPTVFEKPWTFTFAYQKMKDYTLLEYICEDNREFADDQGRQKIRVDPPQR